MEPRTPDAAISDSDLLPGYALGILTPAERAQIEAALATDAALRAELATLSFGVEALALSVEPREPAASLRDRLAAAVAADIAATTHPAAPRPIPAAAPASSAVPPAAPASPPANVTRLRRPAPMNVWALVAAALLIVAVGAVAWGMQQRQALEPVRTIAFAMSDTMPDAHGQIKLMTAPTPMMMMTVENLPALDADSVYEVWLIPHDGAPIPAGTFTDSSMVHAMTGDANDFAAVAITVEPGPMGATAPTTEPFAVASLAAE